MTRPGGLPRSAGVGPAQGTRAVARLGRRSPPYRDHARLTRLWADETHLYLVGPGMDDRWRRGRDGLTEVVHVDTAADDLDHGVDPLNLGPGGWIELPARDGAPERRLAVQDWLGDQDRLAGVEITEPLAASSLGPVLEAAGISVATRRRRPPARTRTEEGPRRSRLPARGESAKLAAVLGAGACSVLALAGVPASSGLCAAAVALAAAVIVAIRIPQVRRLRAERRTRWTASAELRPVSRPGFTRGFARSARLAVCEAELVVIDGAGGELWLGREELTGVRSLAIVADGVAPSRVELRRADGTSLARLPWADWFDGDDGAGLRAFAAANDLPVSEVSESERVQALNRAVGERIAVFGSAGTWHAQQRASDLAAIGLAPGRMPGLVPAAPALLAALTAPGESAGIAIAVAGGAVALAAAGPAFVDGVRRRRNRAVLR